MREYPISLFQCQSAKLQTARTKTRPEKVLSIHLLKGNQSRSFWRPRLNCRLLKQQSKSVVWWDRMTVVPVNFGLSRWRKLFSPTHTRTHNSIQFRQSIDVDVDVVVVVQSPLRYFKVWLMAFYFGIVSYYVHNLSYYFSWESNIWSLMVSWDWRGAPWDNQLAKLIDMTMPSPNTSKFSSFVRTRWLMITRHL